MQYFNLKLELEQHKKCSPADKDDIVELNVPMVHLVFDKHLNIVTLTKGTAVARNYFFYDFKGCWTPYLSQLYVVEKSINAWTKAKDVTHWMTSPRQLDMIFYNMLTYRATTGDTILIFPGREFQIRIYSNTSDAHIENITVETLTACEIQQDWRIYIGMDVQSQKSEAYSEITSTKSSDLFSKLITRSYDIKDTKEYRASVHIQHDMILSVISKYVGGKDFKLPKPSTRDQKALWSEISYMTPDLVRIIDDIVHVFEVTVTHSASVFMEKQFKYDGYAAYIKSHDFNCKYTLIRVDHSASDLYEILTDWSVPHEVSLSIIYDFKIITSNLDRFLMLNPDKRITDWSTTTTVIEDMPIISDQMMEDAVRSQSFNPLGDVSFKEHQMEMQFLGMFETKITNDDDKYLDKIASDIIDEMPDYKYLNPLTSTDDLSESINEFKMNCNMKEKNPLKKEKKVFQLPIPNELVFIQYNYHKAIERLFELNPTEGTLGMITRALRVEKYQSEIAYFQIVGDDEESYDVQQFDDGEYDIEQLQNKSKRHLVELKLSSESKLEMAMEGINKKKYKKMGLVEEDEYLNSVKGFSLGLKDDHMTDVLSMFTIVRGVTSINKPAWFPEMDEYPTTEFSNKHMASLFDDSGFDTVMLYYELLSREIILNAMKRRGKNDFVLCATSIKDVYVIIAPGRKLRTEQETIFVKVCMFSKPIEHKLIKHAKFVGSHYESKWLSVDSERLNTWSRCRDTVNLSIIGISESNTTNGRTYQSLQTEMQSSQLYDIMSSMYIENNVHTSKAVQMSRFLMMKSLGTRQFRELIMDKLDMRIASILQSFLIQRMLTSFLEWVKYPQLSLVKKPKLKVVNGIVDEEQTAIEASVPRIFSVGNFVTFEFSLNEIYLTMFYNKDRQNKTHDAMHILQKIAKEERKFDGVLNDTYKGKPYRYACGLDDLSITDAVNYKREHYYSGRCIAIASKLQRYSDNNSMKFSSCFNSQAIEKILLKPLDDYATFKATVIDITEKISDEAQVFDLAKRTKCVESIIQFLGENKEFYTLADVLKFYITNIEIIINIFKKNQIGGVREILILSILSRIVVNFAEEIAKLMAHADDREQLTKGSKKKLLLKSHYYDLMKEVEGKNTIFILESEDMQTWCQRFIPMQFLYMYAPHKQKLGKFYNYLYLIFSKMCSKKIEFPKELVVQWQKHPDVRHNDAVDYYKDLFRKDGITAMINKSNMGQGILHYNSTDLAVLLDEFRCEIFRRVLIKKSYSLSGYRIRVMLSSDDRSTMKRISMNDKTFTKDKIFDLCTTFTESSFAVKKSGPKSEKLTTLIEFNSTWASAHTSYSVVVKFTIAACQLMETVSFNRAVNQSFTSIRAISENGGSNFLCLIAHHINKRFLESVFATGDGMINNPGTIFGLNDEMVPYDFGLYPIFESYKMNILGPEYHNFMVLTKGSSNLKSLKLIRKTYGMSEDFDQMNWENISEKEFYRKDKIEANVGPTKQLIDMRNRLGIDYDEITEYLRLNPECLIVNSRNNDEARVKSAMKLFTVGAKESLKRISPVIYLGRLAAAKYAKVWKSGKESMTYHDAMLRYIDEDLTSQGPLTDEELLAMFPRANSYYQAASFQPDSSMIEKTFIQPKNKSYRKIMILESLYNLGFSYKSTLINLWMNRSKSEATIENFKVLQSLFPILSDDIDTFKIRCQEEGIRPDSYIMHITSRMMKMNDKSMSLFYPGPNTRDLVSSLTNLLKFNSKAGIVVDFDVKTVKSIDDYMPEQIIKKEKKNISSLPIIDAAYNLIILDKQNARDISKSITLSETGQSMYTFLKDLITRPPFLLNRDDYYTMVYVADNFNIQISQDFKSRLMDLNQISYCWSPAQTKVNGVYTGYFNLTGRYKNEVVSIEGTHLKATMKFFQLNVLSDASLLIRFLFRRLGTDSGIPMNLQCSTSDHGLGLRIISGKAKLQKIQPGLEANFIRIRKNVPQMGVIKDPMRVDFVTQEDDDQIRIKYKYASKDYNVAVYPKLFRRCNKLKFDYHGTRRYYNGIDFECMLKYNYLTGRGDLSGLTDDEVINLSKSDYIDKSSSLINDGNIDKQTTLLMTKFSDEADEINENAEIGNIDDDLNFMDFAEEALNFDIKEVLDDEDMDLLRSSDFGAENMRLLYAANDEQETPTRFGFKSVKAIGQYGNTDKIRQHMISRFCNNHDMMNLNKKDSIEMLGAIKKLIRDCPSSIGVLEDIKKLVIISLTKLMGSERAEDVNDAVVCKKSDMIIKSQLIRSIYGSLCIYLEEQEELDETDEFLAEIIGEDDYE